MAATPQYIWRYGNVDIMYSPELDGCGSAWAPTIVQFVKDHFGNDIHFNSVFEWCAGPAFIGFSMLAEGMCDSLSVADINPAAIDCVMKTIKSNGLENRVRAYVSDNLTSVPEGARFDLVVGNPPCWYAVNPEHPILEFHPGLELLAIDAGWKVHSGFYSNIHPFLNPGASLVIHEIEPRSSEVYLGKSGILWDKRPTEQGSIFSDMICNAGLCHTGDFEIKTTIPFLKSWLQVSKRPSGS